MISSLGYLRIETSDTGKWREFGLKVLGMAEGKGPEREAVYLRMDDFPARLIIVPGEKDRLLASGWEVRDDAVLDRVHLALTEAGVAIKVGTDAECTQRRVAHMIRFDDPSGNVHEVFSNAALDSRPAITPYGTTFVTGDMGMGHVVLPVSQGDTALRFFTEVLGFRLRDTMRMAPELFGLPAGSPPLFLRFLGANARHHSLALAPFPAPPGIVHLMIETGSIDDVGRALDRCGRRGAPVSATLGRHANDHMVSFYVKTPGGFDIEYGTAGRLVDESTWIARETTAISLWGHSFAGPSH
jgi:3,4-dihydroxy-9,10-secoandrosta-1,3,5(10)-triene-9,17-dione 4,5-dioxygenase